jgi:alpha-1,3-rhamnosyl/mannosyltransferase
MQLGTPVISTRASSLPEVGGDAAIWIDPNDDTGLADNIVRVMTDEALNRSMRAASLAQSARFNWDATALMTVEVFEEAVTLARRGA